MCSIHQNTKLLVNAFSGNINRCMRRINRAAAGDANGEEVEEVEKFKVTYRDLMKTIVCDIENMDVRTALAPTLCTHICRRSLKSTM